VAGCTGDCGFGLTVCRRSCVRRYSVRAWIIGLVDDLMYAGAFMSAPKDDQYE